MIATGGRALPPLPTFPRVPLPPHAERPTAMANSLWIALALILIIEGLLPFAAPRLWRDTFQRLIGLTDGQLRFIGLISIGFGLISLALLHA